MVPVPSLLTAIERQDVATLNDLLEHDGMHAAHFTAEEATTLWDVGWQAWLGEGRHGHASWHAGEEGGEWRQETWAAQISPQSSPLWHITLGMFLRVLHASFPALPSAPAWAALRDVEEE